MLCEHVPRASSACKDVFQDHVLLAALELMQALSEKWLKSQAESDIRKLTDVLVHSCYYNKIHTLGGL